MVVIPGLIAGISATAILATGVTAGIGCLVRGSKEQARLLQYAGVMMIFLGMFYLGTVVSFFNLILTGANVSARVGTYLCYTTPPVAAALAMFVGFKMIKPEVAKKITLLYLLTGPFYWIFFFGFSEENMTLMPDPAPELIDFELTGVVLIFVAVYLLSFLLVVAGGFFWLAKKSTGAVKRKSLMLALGFTLFTICGAIDSLVELDAWIFLPRIFMLTGFVLMYVGFNAPE